MKAKQTHVVGFYSSLPHNKKNWREIHDATKRIEHAYQWADKRIRKGLCLILDGYPNNYYTGKLTISANVDPEEVDHYGGFFYPEDNEIVINKYVRPIVAGNKTVEVIDLLKDKKRLRHIITHELIHYAFTEYEYAEGDEKPVHWTVGLCSEENTTTHVDKKSNVKWKIDEWLDEVLTEKLAMHFSGWSKMGVLLYENNISNDDKYIFELVKKKLTKGPLILEDIVNALYYHNKDIFLK